MDIAPDGTARKVICTMNGEKNIIRKLMCLVMGGIDKTIGKDFKSGLASLKESRRRKINVDFSSQNLLIVTF